MPRQRSDARRRAPEAKPVEGFFFDEAMKRERCEEASSGTSSGNLRNGLHVSQVGGGSLQLLQEADE